MLLTISKSFSTDRVRDRYSGDGLIEFLIISGALALLITLANHIITRLQVEVEQ